MFCDLPPPGLACGAGPDRWSSHLPAPAPASAASGGSPAAVSSASKRDPQLPLHEVDVRGSDGGSQRNGWAWAPSPSSPLSNFDGPQRNGWPSALECAGAPPLRELERRMRELEAQERRSSELLAGELSTQRASHQFLQEHASRLAESIAAAEARLRRAEEAVSCRSPPGAVAQQPAGASPRVAVPLTFAVNGLDAARLEYDGPLFEGVQDAFERTIEQASGGTVARGSASVVAAGAHGAKVSVAVCPPGDVRDAEAWARSWLEASPGLGDRLAQRVQDLQEPSGVTLSTRPPPLSPSAAPPPRAPVPALGPGACGGDGGGAAPRRGVTQPGAGPPGPMAKPACGGPSTPAFVDLISRCTSTTTAASPRSPKRLPREAPRGGKLAAPAGSFVDLTPWASGPWGSRRPPAGVDCWVVWKDKPPEDVSSSVAGDVSSVTREASRRTSPRRKTKSPRRTERLRTSAADAEDHARAGRLADSAPPSAASTTGHRERLARALRSKQLDTAKPDSERSAAASATGHRQRLARVLDAMEEHTSKLRSDRMPDDVLSFPWDRGHREAVDDRRAAPVCLKVTAVSARGMPSSSSRTYCVCEVAGRPNKFRTPTVPTAAKDGGPRWDFTMQVADCTGQEDLTFCVYDTDRMRGDDFLGAAVLPAKQFFSEGFDGELPLSNVGSGAAIILHVRVTQATATEDLHGHGHGHGHERPAHEALSEVDQPHRVGSLFSLQAPPHTEQPHPSEPAPRRASPTTCRVTVVAARGLRCADFRVFGGSSDPYCVCEVPGRPGKMFQTPVVKRNVRPEWNHTAEVADLTSQEELVFSIYDWDRFTQADVLGRATLPASQFLHQRFDGELPLENAGKGVCAFVHVVVEPVHAQAVEQDAMISRAQAGRGAKDGPGVAETAGSGAREPPRPRHSDFEAHHQRRLPAGPPVEAAQATERGSRRSSHASPRSAAEQGSGKHSRTPSRRSSVATKRKPPPPEADRDAHSSHDRQDAPDVAQKQMWQQVGIGAAPEDGDVGAAAGKASPRPSPLPSPARAASPPRLPLDGGSAGAGGSDGD